MKHQHWADAYAEKIIRERGSEGHKEFTCASGITPSGTVHIGNFREIISVELVVRALKDKGVSPRFVYSWDDFDVFRKIPANVPNRGDFEQYLRMPITDIPDPWNRAESYALGNEHAIESLLSRFGIVPEYIYQANEYRSGKYAEGIKKALAYKADIKKIHDQYRSTPLAEDWWPISVFSRFSKKDTTSIKSWDGEWGLTYFCEETQQEDTIDIRDSGLVKLLWRIDWPMRWEYEQVVFEPAGKDHHSQGGSFDTAKEIVDIVYGYVPPVTFQYGFVQIKGGSGKLSSSSGEVVSVADMLEIYQPEIVRYLFAGTRPNSEFAISFDLDVIKIYEDYDRCERIYYGNEEVGDARKIKESRIYELSQIKDISSIQPLQIPIRHLCNLLQIQSGNMDAVLEVLKKEYGAEKVESSVDMLINRMECAWSWISEYAPDDFKFSLRPIEDIAHIQEDTASKKALEALRERLLKDWDSLSDKDVNTCVYDAARYAEIESQDLFLVLYTRIIGKAKGPRLGSFLKILGKDIVSEYLV